MNVQQSETPEMIEERELPGGESNGNGVAQSEAPRQPMINEKIVKTYTVPRPLSEVMPHAQEKRRAFPALKGEAEKEKENNDRDFIDDLIREPESMNYAFEVHRYRPSYDDNGSKVRTGRLFNCVFMPLDALRETIEQAFGGGEYRVAIVDKENGKPVRNARALIIKINDLPPKNQIEKGNADIIDPQPTPPADAPEDEHIKEEQKRLENDAKILQMQERSAAMEDRRLQAELRRMIKAKELAELQKRALGGDKEDESKVDKLQQQMLEMQRNFQEQMLRLHEAAEKRREEAEQKIREAERVAREERERTEQRAREERDRLEQRLKEERLEAERRAKEDREERERRAKEERELMLQMIKGVSDSAAKAPPDTGMKDLLVAMQQSSAESIKAIATLVAPKPDNSSDKVFELIKIQNEANRNMLEVSQKRDNRENSMQQKLMETLIAAVLNPQRDAMGPEMILRLIGEGRNQAKEMLELAQGMGGGGGGDDEGGDEGGYDPKLGFLGNAGKAIFGGLQELVKTAANNPQLMEVVMRMFGNRQPTPEQMAAYAYREEQRQLQTSQHTPPALNPPPVHQPQLAAPMQPQHHPGAVPPPVQPQQRQQIVTPPPVTPPPARPAQMQPAPVNAAPQAQAAPAAPASNPNLEVATALEGESVGVSVETPPTSQQPEQPAPQPSAPQAEMNPIELRLREDVSNSIGEAIEEIENKQEKREWWESAHDYWNGDFKQALVRAPDNQARVQMIMHYCEPRIWARLYELISNNGEELAKFYDNLNQFVEANRAVSQAPAASPIPTQPINPAQ